MSIFIAIDTPLGIKTMNFATLQDFEKNKPDQNFVRVDKNFQKDIHCFKKGALILDSIKLQAQEIERTRQERSKEYPPITDQLDMIFHDFEGWKKKIAQIKNKYPKPFQGL